MGKQIRLSEEELSNLIKNKVMEAIEKTGLGYLPAIGNKKRGPGNEIEDQMRKRKNKKLDEAFDEINGSVVAYADKFEDGDVNETIDLSNDAYAYAFEQIYGRVPGDLPDILEDFPEDVDVRFSLSIRITPQSYDFPGDRETEITGWAIDDEWVERLDRDKREIIEKAAEYVIANIDPDTLSASLNESRMSENNLSRIISESIRKVLGERL